jgi:type I restriction enzyme, S subunit
VTPVQLFDHFNRISEAPDAIPRLRLFILDLAVRGKLVEQDPKDEPASELLKRIEAEKARLVKTGEIKKLETFDPVEDHEISFATPPGWEVIRMGWLARKLGAGSTPLGGKTVYQSEGVPFLRSQNVHDDGLRLDDVALISRSVHERMSGTHVQHKDLLLNITGASIGRCALVPSTLREANVSQHVAIIRLFLSDIRQFIHLSLISPFFQRIIDDVQVGVSREGLSMQRLRQFPMLLPPLAEQHRIVAKVDELMTLCDRLEAAQTERESRRDRLAAASLHHLNNGGNADEFQEHARFYFNHLPRLTTRPEHIHQFRQCILNLAVRGKLVPQDSRDEPGTRLLQRIDQERTLVATEDRRADKDQTQILAGECCWEVPPTWGWRGLADLALFIDYRGRTPTKTDSGIRLITAKNVRRGRINLEPQEFITERTYKAWMTRGLPRDGDILFTTEAPMGNAAVVRHDEKFGLAQRVINFRLYSNLDSDFLVLQLLSLPFQAILYKMSTGLTAKGIKAAKLKRLPITVPPLAEQHRIVAQVDELMALCDRLETQLAATQTEGRRLLEAVLHEAPAPAINAS